MTAVDNQPVDESVQEENQTMRYVEPFTQRGSLTNLELAEPMECGLESSQNNEESKEEPQTLTKELPFSMAATFGKPATQKEIKIWKF